MLSKIIEKRGFTLIELMVVVVIIGILASIAIPNFLKFTAKAKQAEARSNLSAIFTSEISYFDEHGRYGTTFTAIGWTTEETSRYEYFLASDQTTGTVSGLTMPSGVAVTATGFTAGATGNIDGETNIYDMWIVNDKKVITNIVNDVTSD